MSCTKDFQELQIYGTVSSHYAFFGGNKADVEPFQQDSQLHRAHFNSSRCINARGQFPAPPGTALFGSYYLEECGITTNMPSPFISLTRSPMTAHDSANWGIEFDYSATLAGKPSTRIMRIETSQTVYSNNQKGSAFEQELAVFWQIDAKHARIQISDRDYTPDPANPDDPAYWQGIHVLEW